MTEFKKGYWNLQELEIQEWIDTKQKGFMNCDAATLKEKIIEDINQVSESIISFGDTTTIINASVVLKIINERFGFDEK